MIASLSGWLTRNRRLCARTRSTTAIVPALAAAAAAACHTSLRTAGPPPPPPRAAARDSVTPAGLVLHRSPEAVRLVTADVPRFWRAFDHATGRDSAARVRAFQAEYLDPGSVGLRDFVRLKVPGGAADLAAKAAAWPRFYAGIRRNTLAVDTSAAVTGVVRAGLRRLSALYPGAAYPDVYFVVGRLTSGGTASANGMLLGVDVFAADSATPLGELSPRERLVLEGSTLAQLPHVVLHETVHYLQPADCCRTLLASALQEGGADFLSELVSGPWLADAVYQRYGRAHEAEVWAAFRREMGGTETGRWIGSWGREDNHGAPDLGYWVGYRITQACYARAADKRAAVRDLVLLRDPGRILSASEYGAALP